MIRLKTLLNERTSEMEIENLIDDNTINQALNAVENQSAEEIKIPESLLKIEANPPFWYTKLINRIRRNRKKIARVSTIGASIVTAEVLAVRWLFKNSERFKEFVLNVGQARDYNNF